MPTSESGAAEQRPFHDLSEFVALPRLAGLTLSADGTRLVTAVAELDADGTKWVTALWEIDPAGERDPMRLTRSAPGESAPTFLPDGTLLFTSKRPDPGAGSGADDPKAALWALPGAGGEARLVIAPPNGVAGVAAADVSGDVVMLASLTPGSADLAADAETRTARRDAGVTAILHESYPVRYWDHDLGPAVPHAFWLGAVPADGADAPELRDLTPDVAVPHGAGESVALSPDGRLMAWIEQVPDGPTGWRGRLVATDTATGTSTVLVDDGDANLASPSFSPDSHHLVCVRQQASTHAEPPDQSLLVVAADGSDRTDVTAGFDRWPGSPVFSADGTAVFFTADDDGHHAVFRVAASGGTPVRLTGSGAFTDLCVATDGSALYALRASIDSPPVPVRLDPDRSDQEATVLPGPGAVDELPGTLTRVEAVADDGSRVQSWLVLPEGASASSPAPLVLWIHGGPLMSWNSWSWRWCPWLLAAQGYAVLLPNPGLSQGFGQDFVRRGWGAWGAEPFTDLMAAVDATIELPEIDADRTAAMGGSFGGYMANWVATQTNRFDAIVTHASLWHLDGFVGTTDASYYWEREFGDPLTDVARYEANSPHRYADAIETPMLVIHGDKDYRVPIGEGLRLWYDLRKRSVESKFLYFPDENHWVLTPGNAMVWYETVLAFLARHVLEQDWERPSLL